MIPEIIMKKISRILNTKQAESFTLHRSAYEELTQQDVEYIVERLKSLNDLTFNFDLGDQPFGDAISNILTQIKIKSLTIDGISKIGAAHIAKMTSLENLNIANSTMTDEDLVSILNLPHLKSLVISGKEIGQKSYEAIVKKPNFTIIIGNPLSIANRDLRSKLLKHLEINYSSSNLK